MPSPFLPAIPAWAAFLACAHTQRHLVVPGPSLCPWWPAGASRPEDTPQPGPCLPLQGKEEFEKTQKELLEKGNIMRQGKGQLELQQVRPPVQPQAPRPPALHGEALTHLVPGFSARSFPLQTHLGWSPAPTLHPSK